MRCHQIFIQPCNVMTNFWAVVYKVIVQVVKFHCSLQLIFMIFQTQRKACVSKTSFRSRGINDPKGTWLSWPLSELKPHLKQRAGVTWPQTFTTHSVFEVAKTQPAICQAPNRHPCNTKLTSKVVYFIYEKKNSIEGRSSFYQRDIHPEVTHI